MILSAYTVCLDLWLSDLNGKVIANGRPDRHPVVGPDVSHEPWFVRAKRLASGDEYAVGDISECVGLKGAEIATYAASVRSGGESHGAPLAFHATPGYETYRGLGWHGVFPARRESAPVIWSC